MSKNNKMTTCKACNAEIDKKAKICPYCGTKNKKPVFKKWWFWVIIVVIIAIIGSASGGSDETENTTEAVQNTNSDDQNEEVTTSSHIYDNAEIKDVMNGTRTEKIGEYSIISITSDEATEEALADWYFNYVEENDYNWCMILFTDKDDNMGVYSVSGYVEKNVYFEEDSYGDYSLTDSAQSIMYYPTDEQTLKAYEE